MKSLLKVSDLPIPSQIVTEKVAFIGVTGSGKTYGASKMAEEFWRIGAQFVVLDPVGVWYGLRLSKDGKSPSDIDIPIFGGLHGDIPLDPQSGSMIADLIVDKNLSVILDVSQFESDADKARFASAFAGRFFFRKKSSPSAVHLFIEECQEFVPQNPQRGEEKMLHEYIRMQKLGRNFGIGSSYITQRPQEVNKKALNMAQTLFVFRTTGTHERKAIEQWIQDKSLDQSIAQDLPKLATGTCHVWSPEFLKVSETVTIFEKHTFNASATPEVGKSAKVVRMADINIPEIQQALAATIEKAKSEDPKLLHAQIARLKADINKNLSKTPQSDRFYTVLDIDKAAKDAVHARDEEWKKKVFDMQGEWLKQTTNWMNIIIGIGEAMKQTKKDFPQKHKIKMSGYQILPPHGVSPSSPRPSTTADTRYKGTAPDNTPSLPSGATISNPQLRILNALAWLAGTKIVMPPRAQVAALSEQSVRSSGFANNLSSLKSMGLVNYSGPGLISITPAGMEAADVPERMIEGQDVRDRAESLVSAPQWSILKVLINAYPEDVTRGDCATEAGQSVTSSGYANNISNLKSMGFLTYSGAGLLRAADILFI